jgi:hypothetical protein
MLSPHDWGDSGKREAALMVAFSQFLVFFGFAVEAIPFDGQDSVDKHFRKAEQMIDEAQSFPQLLRALVILFHALFGNRPATRGQMVKMMRGCLENGANLEAKRQIAHMLVRSLQTEISRTA